MYGISTLKCNGSLLTVHILQGLFQFKRENCLKTKLSVTKKLNRNTVSGHGLGFIFIDLIPFFNKWLLFFFSFAETFKNRTSGLFFFFF